MKQIQDAYIVAATRTPVAKRNGMFRSVRPDDMLAHVLKAVVGKVPGLDATEIGDVIVGCAMPEAEQGMNVARIGLLLAGLPLSTYSAFREAVDAMREGGFISAWDYRVAKAAATALCGGEVDTNARVSEQWLLDVERALFVDLLKTEKTQQRIAHMLETGKPLRN